MTAEELTTSMLGELRRDFYRADKQFFQERDLLISAIAYPATYLNERGVKAGASKYRSILRTVIGTIKSKGNRGSIHSFGRYFLYCVQQHMRHHGDAYYHEAKEPRTVEVYIDPILRKLRRTEATETTDALVQARRAISVRSGRRKAPASKQPELFSRLKN
jgi:hypothetical protein